MFKRRKQFIPYVDPKPRRSYLPILTVALLLVTGFLSYLVAAGLLLHMSDAAYRSGYKLGYYNGEARGRGECRFPVQPIAAPQQIT